jgi:ribosome-binding protein aMBF1 (putative translation factor)
MLLSFVLDSIGEDHGAVDALFNRFENEVVGLPGKGKVSVGEIVFLFPNFPLRLYALRINNRPDLVVLFNGGVKSAQTNQGSRDLNLKWREACQFAKRIEEAIRNEEIIVDQKKRRLFANSGEDEIFLYKCNYMRSNVAKKIQDETPEEVRIFVRQYTDIVLRINQILLAKGYTQKDLADRMKKKPSEINKWLKGNHNLTLKTLAKLEAELGEPIISISTAQLRKGPKKQIA